MIRQKTCRVRTVLEMLDCLSLGSLNSNDISVVNLLTADEITEVIRGLKANKSPMAKLIRELRHQFPREYKFPVRHALLTMACAIASANQKNPPPRKLHRL